MMDETNVYRYRLQLIVHTQFDKLKENPTGTTHNKSTAWQSTAEETDRRDHPLEQS
jgi:hypothetical protein